VAGSRSRLNPEGKQVLEATLGRSRHRNRQRCAPNCTDQRRPAPVCDAGRDLPAFLDVGRAERL